MSLNTLLACALALAPALLAACGSEAPPPTPSPPAGEPDPASAADPQAVRIQDRKVGEGVEAREGDRIQVHYRGQLEDGTVFDSSFTRGQPITFPLERGSLIAGWIEGIPGMREGGEREIWIPWQKAYGARGRPPLIPARANLRFEVHLIDVVGR